MKISKKYFISFLVIMAFVAVVGRAYATIPFLSINPTGGTDSAIVNVTGDPNSSITLYYYGNGSPVLQNRYLGNTNNAGFFSSSINTNSYGVTPGGSVYVTVNNQQSPSVIWPTSFTYSPNSFYLSQTNLSLYVGQSYDITAYNTYGTPFLYNNSNTGVATATINGNSISIYGRSTGNTTLTFCQSGNTSSCVALYVNVGGSNASTGTLALNISNIILPIGGSATISSPNSTSLYVSGNTNSGVVSASSSPSVLGCTATSLYSIITGQPCLNYNTNYYASSYSYIPGCIPTSQYSITTGQPCYNSAGNNGSITISGISAGSSTLTLCQNNYGSTCGTVFVTVTGNYSNQSSYYVQPSTIINTDYSNIPIVYSR